ncbi:MAG: DNA replication and repair protein RecF [Chitinophagales bacterium]|nr:DNA replication and repair protein RecF [Chitinophagales bacterium]
MFLSGIKLLNFRNHSESSFSFRKKITCIVGNNGVGKTNLLDAVYYLCLTKSYLFADDKQNVKHGADFFRLESSVEVAQLPVKLVCKYLGGRKKEFLVNDKPYVKLSEHIGQFPCVMICPADAEIITGGSEERRKVLDGTLSQTDADYLNVLLLYNKVLAQRNAALKQFGETGKVDYSLLGIYNEQLVSSGEEIFRKRAAAMEVIRACFAKIYAQISGTPSEAVLNYVSQLQQKSFKELLQANVQKDIVLERTEMGIHKDDVELLLQGYPVKRFGSQGQQKSFMLAYKLAMFLYIKQQKGFAPLLLVDDVFDKLDKLRSKNLLDFFNSPDTAQVLLSHTKANDFEGIEFIDIQEI